MDDECNDLIGAAEAGIAVVLMLGWQGARHALKDGFYTESRHDEQLVTELTTIDGGCDGDAIGGIRYFITES